MNSRALFRFLSVIVVVLTGLTCTLAGEPVDMLIVAHDPWIGNLDAFVLLVGDAAQVATPTVQVSGDIGASDP